MLITEDVSGRPEIRRVRMPGACHQDVVITLHLRVITGIEHVEPIKILQIKANSSLRPVDFQVIGCGIRLQNEWPRSCRCCH